MFGKNFSHFEDFFLSNFLNVDYVAAHINYVAVFHLLCTVITIVSITIIKLLLFGTCFLSALILLLDAFLLDNATSIDVIDRLRII